MNVSLVFADEASIDVLDWTSIARFGTQVDDRSLPAPCPGVPSSSTRGGLTFYRLDSRN